MSKIENTTKTEKSVWVLEIRADKTTVLLAARQISVVMLATVEVSSCQQWRPIVWPREPWDSILPFLQVFLSVTNFTTG